MDPEEALSAFMGQGSAMIGEIMRQVVEGERFEYKLVPWAEVNKLAAEGWQMVPVPALIVPDQRSVELGFAPAAGVLWMMCRKLGLADAAQALLANERPGGGL